MTATGNCNSN